MIRTEHNNLVFLYNRKWYMICDPSCYHIFKQFSSKGIIVLERSKEFIDEYFKDKNFEEIANNLRPNKRYYNYHPQYSDMVDVYLRHKANNLGVLVYGDIDAVKGDSFVSIKPSVDCGDDNHWLYEKMDKELKIKFKKHYDN